jgi:hypothetical protein
MCGRGVGGIRRVWCVTWDGDQARAREAKGGAACRPFGRPVGGAAARAPLHESAPRLQNKRAARSDITTTTPNTRARARERERPENTRRLLPSPEGLVRERHEGVLLSNPKTGRKREAAPKKDCGRLARAPPPALVVDSARAKTAPTSAVTAGQQAGGSGRPCTARRLCRKAKDGRNEPTRPASQQAFPPSAASSPQKPQRVIHPSTERALARHGPPGDARGAGGARRR